MRKEIKFIVSLGLLFSLSLFFRVVARAQELPGIFIILDASRSMLGKFDNKTKINNAQSLLNDLIKNSAEGIPLGVVVFGSRRSSDCTDIEEVIEYGLIDREYAIKKISEIEPKGKTPLGASILYVAKRLKELKTKASIIVLSDGIETCGKDPCQLTKDLLNSGHEFFLDVIGLGVTATEKKELACLAEAGRGRLDAVVNSEEFAEALSGSVKRSLKRNQQFVPIATLAPLPDEIATRLPSQIKDDSTLKSSGQIAIKIPLWAAAPAYWKLLDFITLEEIGVFKDLEVVTLPVGKYLLAWRQYENQESDLIFGKPLEIKNGRTTNIDLATGVELITPSWVKPPRAWGFKNLTNDRKVAQFSLLERVIMPAGKYRLFWRQSESSAEVDFGEVTIVPNRVNTFALSSAAKVVLPSWLSGRFSEIILVDSKGISVFKSQIPFEQTLLPAGDYLLKFKIDDLASADITYGNVYIPKNGVAEMVVDSGLAINHDQSVRLFEGVKIEVSGENGELRWRSVFDPLAAPVPLASGVSQIKLFRGKTLLTQKAVEIKSGFLALLKLSQQPSVGYQIEVDYLRSQ
ncbi:MAG TPA: VWA domain-containing protein [Oligoflexia bacterium]|nr:VWA domain-containing protein [Oligoflexia bacterium]HMP27450.1 VWA domain-containing protein [Oligoflexia bacterium]